MKKLVASVVSVGLLCSSVTVFAQSTDTVNVKRGTQKVDSSVQVAPPISKAQQALATFNSSKSKNYKPGEVIVKFKSSYSTESLGEMQTKLGLTTKKNIGKQNIKLLKFSSSSSMEDVLKSLNASPQVEYAEPNYIIKPTAIKEPMFGQLWGLKNTGQVFRGVKGKAGIDIGVESAWSVTRGSSDVVVAVIDTGIDITHSDLKSRIWKNPGEIPGDKIDNDKNGYVDDVNGWDFFNGDNTVFDAEDGDEHGTHVAGTIAGAENKKGVIGVAPNVKIMPLKFLGPWGGDDAGAIEAIEYAKDKGIKISNNSWGGYGHSQALYDAIKDSDSLFVSAAGNDGMDNDNGEWKPIPASFDLPNILSVAAIDHTGNLAMWSNFGKTSVDIAAPGVDILSSVPQVTPADVISYAYYSGTSMATPHVSGAAALVLSKNKTLSPVAIKTAITKTAKPLSSLKGMVASGGLLNAGKAVVYELDSDIPGVPLTSSKVSGTLNAANDADDVYAVTLLKGESLTVLLSGKSGTDFDLYLYNSKTQALTETGNIVAYSEKLNTSTESVTYVAPKDGTYYVAASAYKGSGNYTLTVGAGVGAGTYENTQKELGYTGTWTTVSDKNVSGGSYALAKQEGAKIQFVFSGTAVTLTGLKDATQGIAKVTVDGVSSEVSLYSNSALYKQQFFKKKGLKAGRHVVTIEWTGKAAKGAKRSANAINLDTIIVK